MKELMIIMDSVRYDVFLETDTPNIDKLGDPVEATTHGSWTRPSVTSMLSGYLPHSEYGQIWKPSWAMGSPDMLGRETSSWFLNANAWMKDIGPSRFRQKFYEEQVFQAPHIVRDAEKIMKDNIDYLIVMFLIETHGPYRWGENDGHEEFREMQKAYNNGEDNDAPLIAMERSIKSVEALDPLLAPILDLPERIIITSDHGDLMGEHHKIGHSPTFPFHYALLEVPLIIDPEPNTYMEE